VPDCFPVIKLLAKSRLGIPFCENETNETSYVNFMGVKLLNLINREKVVKRKKLDEFNLSVEHKGMCMFLGMVWVGGGLQGCTLMTPFWCNSYWIYKPTLSTITLCSNNIGIIIEN
jgi:hypothetical protein